MSSSRNRRAAFSRDGASQSSNSLHRKAVDIVMRAHLGTPHPAQASAPSNSLKPHGGKRAQRVCQSAGHAGFQCSSISRRAVSHSGASPGPLACTHAIAAAQPACSGRLLSAGAEGPVLVVVGAGGFEVFLEASTAPDLPCTASHQRVRTAHHLAGTDRSAPAPGTP
jgi:hypothetical protein